MQREICFHRDEWLALKAALRRRNLAQVAMYEARVEGDFDHPLTIEYRAAADDVSRFERCRWCKRYFRSEEEAADA